MLSKCMFRTLPLAIKNTRSLNVGILGVPFSGGQTTDGTELAPNFFRKSGLIDQVERIGHRVVDYGDVAVELNKNVNQEWDLPMKYSKSVFEMIRSVSSQVQTVLRAQDVCVTLGGDHSIGIGTVHGTAQVHQNLSLLWIDAHSDINTFATTNSKNAHGMSLSFLVKDIYNRYNESIIQKKIGSFFKPCIPSSQLVYIGLRDLEDKEILLLKEFNIKYFGMRELDLLGIDKVMEQALDAVNPKADKPIHVSMDVDSLDGPLVPNTVLPTLGGISAREAFFMAETISSTGLLKTLDFVEVNPLLGDRNHLSSTLDLSINIILAFLGKKRYQLFARSNST